MLDMLGKKIYLMYLLTNLNIVFIYS